MLVIVWNALGLFEVSLVLQLQSAPVLDKSIKALNLVVQKSKSAKTYQELSEQMYVDYILLVTLIGVRPGFRFKFTTHVKSD